MDKLEIGNALKTLEVISRQLQTETEYNLKIIGRYVVSLISAFMDKGYFGYINQTKIMYIYQHIHDADIMACIYNKEYMETFMQAWLEVKAYVINNKEFTGVIDIPELLITNLQLIPIKVS